MPFFANIAIDFLIATFTYLPENKKEKKYVAES